KDITILYGYKDPSSLLFNSDLESWGSRGDVDFKVTVDECRSHDCWEGNVGVITTLIPDVDIDPDTTMAIVVGPPVMYKYVIRELKQKGVPDENIIVSVERRMKCGVGKCGHCQINGVYVCLEGPVFNYADIKELPEAF
ncbi:MAG: oxidoreductase, partial [Chloroflexota bacterium]